MYKTAIIAAAGKGSRFNNLKKPKGFLDIGGKPLIQHSIEALKNHGIERFIVGTGYKSEYYKNYKEQEIVTVPNDDYERSGSLQTIYRCRNLVDENVLLLDSDILYEPYCIRELLNDKRPDVILLGSEKGQKDCVYVDNNAKMSKNRNEIPYPAGVIVGITKISRETWHQVMEYAAKPEAWQEHHDWAFMHTKNKFGLLVLSDLLFTEIDDDEQLNFALSIYPKLSAW